MNRIRIAALAVLALGVDCRCIEHPLYDAGVNRFDTFYLGGGNTQYRPFRRGELAPDATLDVEVVLDHETTPPRLRVLVLDQLGEGPLRGALVHGDHTAALAAVDDEQLELTLDDDALAALAAADTAQARVWDDAGEAVVVELDVAEITRALAEADADRTGGER
ncbi:MAG: hypothetical protein K1X88_29105 [Nannocystaceae bacterium]|nr:hypothetical protein [Nannocystaceae bacterium]